MGTYQDTAAALATQYGLDPAIFVAQINAESGFDPNAVSPAGCRGIAQICDAVTFNPFDPIASLRYAANRMAMALAHYGGSYPLALASYNCGVGCADAVAAGTRSLPAETRTYIARILGSGSSSSSSTPATDASSSSGFAPAPLSPQIATIAIVFAAIVVLLGLVAMARGGSSTPAAA